MQYPRMGQTRQYRVTVPELNGGVNYAVPPHRIGDNQLSDAVNMWYQNGALKTRPALKGVKYFPKGMQYTYQSTGEYGYALDDSDEKSYVALIDETGNVRSHHFTKSTSGATSMMPVSANTHLSEHDYHALVYMKGPCEDDSGVFGLKMTDYNFKTNKMTPYVPTVLINGKPVESITHDVEGTQLEPYNMISEECVLRYTPNGVGSYFRLPFTDSEIISVEYTGKFLNGSYPVPGAIPTHDTFIKHPKEDDVFYEENPLVDGYALVYNRSLGCFWFVAENPQNVELDPDSTPAKLPESTDPNVLTVRVRRGDDQFKRSRDAILGMKFSTWYGGGSAGLTGGTRLFVSGNPECPNLVHWSALNNPLYFPENNFAYVGEDTSAVTAFGKQNDMLVIFKENAVFYSTYVQGNTVTAEDIQSQEVTDIEAAQAMFPMMQIHPEIGCDCPNTIQLCNNRLVWLNSDGNVYGLFSSGVYNERNLRRLSLQLGDRLRRLGKEVLKTASAARHDEQYLLLVGDSTVYAMDYSSYGFNYYGSYSTDEKAQKAVVWHKWEFPNHTIEALLRVRDTAVFVSSSEEWERMSTFLLDSEKHTDEQMMNSWEEFSVGGTINSSFRTKLFDFGHSERFKRVNSLYLQITGEIGKNAFLTYHNGKDEHANADAVVFFETAPEATTPQLIRPNAIRTRLFGFEVNSSCYMEVGDLIINYSTMGAIR